MQQNILVIQLGPLDQFLKALGVMAAIRARHTEDHITLLTTEAFAEMAQLSGYFDQILVDLHPKIFDIGGWLALRAALNAAQFSHMYDLQETQRTGFYRWLMSPRPVHMNAQDLTIVPDKLAWMERDLSGFALKKPYIVLIPAYSENKAHTVWPTEQYRALISKLLFQGFHPLILGAKGDENLINQILRGIVGVLNLTGKTTFFEVASIAREAVAVIGGHTTPMTIASMTGCPVIILDGDLKNSPASEVWAELQEIIRSVQ